MIYNVDAALLKHFILGARKPEPPNVFSFADKDILENLWEGINREWKKDLRAMYMEVTSLLLAILKPRESWTSNLQKVETPGFDYENIQKVLLGKCAEMTENLLEELRLAAEEDYPSDTVAQAATLKETIRGLKKFCRSLGVPKLQRRRAVVRAD